MEEPRLFGALVRKEPTATAVKRRLGKPADITNSEEFLDRPLQQRVANPTLVDNKNRDEK
jgi:hypothetical protein